MKKYEFKISLVIPVLLCLLSFPVTAAMAYGPETAPDQPVVVSIGEDGVQRIEIVGGEYYFEPKHIIVKVNTPVELLVKKTGGFVPHNIIVKAPEAGMDFDVSMKNEFTPISFTPTRTGSYPMYCDKRFLWFKTHQHKGMEGTIKVVE